ncbi:MAG: peptidase M16, partial [Verrucomicrobiae bacterium]|nr:peptidase M16 [Verrucomicrobiae bacterium]
MHTGQTVSGFEIAGIESLPELRAQLVKATHVRSGAQLLHVHAPDDAENLFAVTFATPPPDDTGLPHILEHVVLGGSRRFPVKEPFFEMVKMSMATFINALTYQAFTTYPVASNVKKDFFNL